MEDIAVREISTTHVSLVAGIWSRARRAVGATVKCLAGRTGNILNVDGARSDRAQRFVTRYGETREAWDTGGFLDRFSGSVIYAAHPEEIVEGKDALRRYFEKEQEAQGEVRVQMGSPLVEGDRVMAEFWVIAQEDASIAGCLIADLDPDGVCTTFREYWFDLEGRCEPFEGWGA